MRVREILAEMAAAVVLGALAGCGGGGDGGGGGGGDAPIAYRGSTSAAVLTDSNAGQITADAIGSTDVVAATASVAPVLEPATAHARFHLARLLTRALRGPLMKRSEQGASAHSLAPVDSGQEPCDNGGTLRIFGDLGSAGTGTLNVIFTNCRSDQDAISGEASLRIRAVGLDSLGDSIPVDFTLSFARLAIRGSASIDIGGSVRVLVDVPSNRETATENVVALFLASGRMRKSENLVFVDVYDDLSSPTSYTETVSGRVFNSIHGFVDVSTVTPLVFSSVTQDSPDRGLLALAGALNRSILVTLLPSGMLRLALDLDGDGAFENAAALSEAQLSGPVGADLLDGDGDGMHNSWESVRGVTDPAGDEDGDGFSNLSEYHGGGNPGDDASLPALLASALTAASDVATANSDLENPGPTAIASDGRNYLLVSCRSLGATVGLFGVLVGGNGQVLSDFPIVSDTCPRNSAVAFDGDNYLVVRSANTGQVVGMRITAAGAALDGPAGFVISTPSAGTVNFRPAVAFDGTNYLVIWVNSFSGGHIRGARVTPAASVLNEFVVSAGNFDTEPYVAYDGSSYLVVWTRGSPPENEDVYGARVSPAGTVVDSPAFAIASLLGRQRAGGVAFDGMNYLVVWDHASNVSTFPPPDGAIFGRRISTAGGLLGGAAGDPGIAISTGPFNDHSSSVAFAGSSFIVTWGVGGFPNFPPAGIFATRVSKDGVRVDGPASELGVPISGVPPAFARFVHPVAASDGQNALIAWVNNIELSGTQKDVLAARIFGP